MRNKAQRATMLKGLRRVRKPNYTREETEILLDQLLVYGNFLFGKSQPGVNHQQRADVWANIAAMVNAVPNSAGRTVEELKHRWQDLAQRARMTLRRSTDDKQDALQKQMPYLDLVLKIMGEYRPNTASSKGVPSPVPSSYASDLDASSSLEIKQETSESPVKESNPVILNQTVSSLKKVLPPLKTPSFKRFKKGRGTSASPSAKSLGHHSPENGMPSLGSSLNQHNLAMETPAVLALRTSLNRKRKSGDMYATTSPSLSHSSSRPMVMDPESHLVMEVDLMDEGEDRSSGSTEVNHEASEIYGVQDNACGNTGRVNGFDKCADDYAHAQTHREKRKPGGAAFCTDYSNVPRAPPAADEANSAVWDPQHLEGLATVQLQRLCLIGKIRLQNQQRSYVKLKEEKLRLEMEFLRTKVYPSPSPKVTEVTSAAAAYHEEAALHSNLYNLDHRDHSVKHHQQQHHQQQQNLHHHHHYEQPKLSPISASGGLEFEVAEDSKHHNNETDCHQGGTTDRSNGKPTAGSDSELEEGDEEDSDGSPDEESEDRRMEMRGQLENHVESGSEASDSDTGPRHDI